MNSIAECTVPEKILLAAYALEEAGESPFTAEALVVSAWRKYPITFGLKQFAEKYQLRVHISAITRHFPTRTLSISLIPAEEKAA